MASPSLEPNYPRRRRPLGLDARACAAAARGLEEHLARGAVGRLALELDPGFRPPMPPPPRQPSRPRSILIALGKAILLAHLAFLFLTSFLVIVYRFADPSVTVLMAYRKWGYGWKLEAPRPRELKAIPAYVRAMLVSVEDHKFYQHHGLDFEAFQRAYEVNARLGRPLYGGSTLTMQVARTLFLVPEKSYVRKYLEILVALELEAFLPKERILELYFGYAEWGKGLFGIEAAARAYYGAGLTKLSRDQVARLVALLSSPIKYRPGNLERSGILRERYRYLQRRYLGGQPAPAESHGAELKRLLQDEVPAAEPAESATESAQGSATAEPEADTGTESPPLPPETPSASTEPVPGTDAPADQSATPAPPSQP